MTTEFDELRKQIDADPARRANVEEHKTAMLGELSGSDEIDDPRPERQAEGGSDAWVVGQFQNRPHGGHPGV